MQYVELYAALVLAGVLGLAAILKTRERADFASSMVALGLVPRRFAQISAAAVIVAEFTTAVACLIPGARVAGLSAGIVLLGSFAAVAVYATRRPPVPCRCFGTGTVPLGRRHVVRNLLLVAVALVGLIGALSWGGDVRWPAFTLPLVLAAVTVGVVARADDLIDLFASPSPAPDRRR